VLKFHPAYDQLWGDVLRADPRGLLVLKQGRYRRATSLLRQRFARTLLDVLERVVWLPWLSRSDYFRLLSVADVVLDTLPFGAGTTAYDVLSLNQLLVTLPGQFNVGRLTQACYRQMGLSDLIAGRVRATGHPCRDGPRFPASHAGTTCRAHRVAVRGPRSGRRTRSFLPGGRP
jgi:predicted O-linked N-acetylglucosamine transferase (SPINDLY family)